MSPSTQARPRRSLPHRFATSAAVAGIALVGLVIAGAGWMLHDARRTARGAGEHAVQNLVLGTERDIGRTIEGYDLSLKAAARALSSPDLDALAPEARGKLLFDGATEADHVGGIVVFDGEGRPVYNSRAPLLQAAAAVNVADRDYFRAHRDRSDVGLFVSAPFVGRLDGGHYVGLSRRLNAPDGTFAGVVTGTIRLDHIQGLFGALKLGERGSMTLFTTDGKLVVRHPHDERHMGRDMRHAALFAHLARSPAGTFEAVAALDGVPRLYAYRQVGSLPLVLIAGFSERGIYASWTRTAWAVGAALLVMLLVAAGLGSILRGEFRRRARAERAARRAEGQARRAGQAAHASAAQLQLITNNTDDLLLHLDWDGTRRYVSPACERLLGRPPAELLGRSLYEFVHPEDRLPLEAALAEMRRGERPSPVVSRVLRSDGTWRHFEASGRGLRNDAGAIVIVRDVTERVRVEERLRRGQRMEAVGRLTAGVAHDFNNVLAALLGNLELALEDGLEAAEVREHLQLALQAGRRGERLTGHLLSFSRQQALRPEAVDLPPLLGELSRTLSRTLGRDVAPRVEVRPGLPHAFADAAHLDAALLNLALNARDAMPGGGELRVEAYAEAEGVVVAVSDTGEGMAPEVLARACEPFFTTKGLKGSGLGLSMVQGFAHQSGGELRIHSEPGRGTRVELRLPAVAPAAASPQPPQARSSGRGRVLVVDDDADVGRVAAAFLRKAGFDVAAAAGADQALAVLGAAGAFDALVTDFAMPGMDGAELVLRAREAQPGLPALVITGYAGAEALERLPADVATLRKPFQREDLARRVKGLVEGARTAEKA